MTKVFIAVLFAGSLVCGATNFPSHIGMGSKASTVGKLSSYSPAGDGTWTGYWKPKGFTVSVREEVQAHVPFIWPNPTTGILSFNQPEYVTVLSILGTPVFEGLVEGSIDLSAVAPGVYFVRSENGTTTKIIKQ
jgi:hypothetical protein